MTAEASLRIAALEHALQRLVDETEESYAEQWPPHHTAWKNAQALLDGALAPADYLKAVFDEREAR